MLYMLFFLLLFTCSGALLINTGGSFCKMSRKRDKSVDKNFGYSEV